MKIFSFTLPLAVGGLAAWLTMGSMSQYVALALVLVTARAFYRIDKQAGWLLVPYLAWLIYAAYLNAGVWFLNK